MGRLAREVGREVASSAESRRLLRLGKRGAEVRRLMANPANAQAARPGGRRMGIDLDRIELWDGLP